MNISLIDKDYPWINFRFDLGKISYEDWLRIGKCVAWMETLAHTPLKPDAARELLKVYLAKGVHATTAIEGNTLSEEEVRQAVDGRLQVPESRAYLKREVENVIRVCNEIVENPPERLSVEIILDWNRRVLDGLELPEEVEPGVIRKHRVGVGRYQAPPPAVCGRMLARLVDWLNAWRRDHPGLEHGILRAIVGHLYLAWIHPFGDGNGRTARILELAILYAEGAPMPAAHLLSNHYNATRQQYYLHLEKATARRDPAEFIRYAVQGLHDQLEEQLQTVRGMVRKVMFRDLVYDLFRETKTETAWRRRALVLDLLEASERGASRAVLMSLTERLAQAYRGRTGKTLTRDLNALQEMGLVRVEGAWVRPNLAIVDMLLPRRVRRAAS